MTSPGTRTLKVKVDGDARGLVGAGRDSERALLGVDGQVDKTARNSTKLERGFGTASRSVIRDLDRIEREAWASGEGMDQAFTQSIRSMRDELARLTAEGKRTGASLNSELGGSLRDVKNQVDELQGSLKGGGQGGIGDLVGDLLGDFSSVKGGVLAAGAAIGSTLWQGLQSAWEQDRVGGLIVAQTGAASSASRNLGDLAGDIFYDAYGESIEQVGEAMTAVFQNRLLNTDADEEAIERVTKKVLTLSQTTGESANDISRAARQLFVTGMAGSLSEGLDMIQHATERGLNTSGDLLDTIEEYSIQFRALGLSGQQSFGLIDQAIEGGARNVDLVADALKEFQILAQESTGTAKRGFEALGLDAASSAEKIARGGASARDVLGEVLDRLRAMPDGVARNSIAVDLFGTKAEDLGNALYSMDLDTAVEQFGDLSGAVDAAGEAIAAAESPLEKLGRGIADWANTVVGKLQEVKSVLESSDEVFFGDGEAAEGAEEAAEKTNELADATDNAAESAEEFVGTLDSLIAKQREWATGAIDLTEAQIDSAEAVADANEAMNTFAGQGLNATKNGFDLGTEAGQKMQGALNDVVTTTFDTIEAMRQQGATSQEVRAYLESQRTAFYNLATGMGISAEAAQALTNKLFGLPGQVVPVVGLQDNASPGLQNVLNKIAAIKADPVLRTDYYLYTHAIQSNSVRDLSPTYQGRGGRATGGPVWSGEWYRVNERGEEWFRAPNTGGHVMPNHEVNRADGDTVVYVTIDGQQLQGRIDRTVRENNRALKRAASSGTGGAT